MKASAKVKASSDLAAGKQSVGSFEKVSRDLRASLGSFSIEVSYAVAGSLLCTCGPVQVAIGWQRGRVAARAPRYGPCKEALAQ